MQPPRPSGPPPRPQLTSDVVPPWLEPDEGSRPRSAWVVLALALAAVVSGIGAMIAVAADGSQLRQRLTDVAIQGDPSAPEDLVRSGVRTTLLLVLGVQSVLVVLVLLWLVLFLRRRSWARWALVGTGVVTVAFAALAQDVVVGGPDLDRLAFLVEAAAMGLAVAVLLSRPVGTWLRTRDR